MLQVQEIPDQVRDDRWEELKSADRFKATTLSKPHIGNWIDDR